MVDEYGNVSVIELELTLIDGLAKVREIGMKQAEEANEESNVVQVPTSVRAIGAAFVMKGASSLSIKSSSVN